MAKKSVTTKEEIEEMKLMLAKVFSNARTYTATTLPENEAAMYSLIAFKDQVLKTLDKVPLD